MTRNHSARIGALLLAASTLGHAFPAAAQALPGCNAGAQQEAPKKKSGLGGLLRSVGGAGLRSVVAAATGGGSAEAALEAAGQRAVDRAAADAVDCIANADAPVDQGTGAPDSAGGAGTASATVAKPAARAAKNPTYTADIPDPPGFAEVKRAYDDFGKVACKECEGGFAFDGWPVYPRDEFSSKYAGSEKRMGTWPIGHVHRWKGTEATGTLTVTGEQTVSGFRCRTLVYRLTKGQASAERPGLICWGRRSQFAGSESWNEVY